jgi:hypothetical protein
MLLLLLIRFGAKRPRSFEVATLRVICLWTDFYIANSPIFLMPGIEARASRNTKQG